MSYEFEPACRRMEWLDPFYKTVWEKAFADAIPISGTFELTPRCNFNCKMCYVHLKNEDIPRYGRELTAAEWLRIAGEAKEAGTTWLCITGGEPLLHPEFETIYRELSQMGFFITLQTNASLIRGKMAKLLEDYPPRQCKVTLYGSNDKVYEAVCGVKHGFTMADEGLKTLLALKIPVELVSTVIRQNVDDVKNMAYYAFSHHLPWVGTGGVKDSCRVEDSLARSVRVEERMDISKREEIRYRLEKAPVNIERKPCTYCRDYRLGYWVVWNGDMRFCSFMNEPQISLKEMPLKDAWSALVEYEENLDWPDECKSCRVQSICFKCAGLLASECGSPHQVKKEFCDKILKIYDELKGE